MNQIQLIASGVDGRGERVVLWRKGDYNYELEIGSGVHNKKLGFYETDYYVALDMFDAACENYHEYDDAEFEDDYDYEFED